MAISFVGSTSTAVLDQATFNFALPTCLEGDIVIVVVGSSAIVDDTTIGVTTAGYTEEAELYANDSLDSNFSVSWKRMGAVPDTSVDCEGTAGASYGTTAVAYVLRGVDTTTAIDVATTTATGTDSAIPDCPSITPVTSGAWVIACGSGTTNDSTITAPAGYTNHYFKENTSSYGNTTAICSKEWSGSGAEDPPAWTDWSTSVNDSWAAVTLALRPENVVEPPSGTLTLTGQTPAIAPAPGPGTLTLTGQTPTAGTAIPVYPLVGSVTLTGQTPVPLVAVSVYPATDQIAYTGQVPQVIYNRFNVTLPAISSYFESLGSYSSLEVALPEIEFYGETSQPSWLEVTLPEISAEFMTGGGLEAEIPLQDILFTAKQGITSSLGITLPEIVFSASTGGYLLSELPEISAQFGATVGTVASLIVPLPAIAGLFEASVENLGQLAITLPPIVSAFSASDEIISNLIVEFPALTSLFTAQTGITSSINVTLPAIEALMSSYTDITGEMVIVLPALKALLEASQSGRFDTATQTQIDGTILKWRRPV